MPHLTKIAPVKIAPVKIALVGAGLIGKRHAKILQALPETELTAIIDPMDDAKAVAQSFNSRFYCNIEAAFASETFDGCILATPTPLHVAQGMLCIQHQCPMLIEKPIATSAAAALELVELSEQHDIPILVGHHRRYNPLILRAKQLITQGEIGDVRAIQAVCWFYKPDKYFNDASWRKLKGAGPISVNLAHDIDLLQFLCGDIISVQAQAAQSKRGFENEDVAAALLRFNNGAIGTISVSDSVVSPWSWEMTSGENPAYHKTTQNTYYIGGSKGAFSVPDLNLWHHEKQPDWFSPLLSQSLEYQALDPLANQMKHFVDVIQKQAQPLISGRQGYKTLRVIEAIQQSAQSHALISLTP
ncbi:MAG: Gfo/Idh/MocA family oxidoreductase [Alphaproteobacteria bacterium]|nr:Gfo/Idh/MocA family oxidoreductase [Alphaproteobacteria bacterium]